MIDRSDNGLAALYREVILDHHRAPRNKGKLEPNDAFVESFNPLCGDRIELTIRVDRQAGKLAACRFQGEGCSICMSSASMMMEELEGKGLREVGEFVENFRMLMRGEKCPLLIEGDLEAIVGVRNFPVRIKCALLPWTAMGEALAKAGGTK